MPIAPDEWTRFKDEIVWRVIAAHRRQGHWEYLFDDYVITPKLGEYMIIMNERGAERITLKRIGPLQNTLLNDREHLVSAGSVNEERKNHKLENFLPA